MKRSDAERIRARVFDQLDDVMQDMFRAAGDPRVTATLKSAWKQRWQEQANLAVMGVLNPEITSSD